MWTNGNGFFYLGDMVPGDRAATDAELAARQAALAAVVPESVPAGDFVTALYQLGWIDAVKAAVNTAGGLSLDLWNHASTFQRSHPIVSQIGAAIGKTSADLDQLFILSRNIGTGA